MIPHGLKHRYLETSGCFATIMANHTGRTHLMDWRPPGVESSSIPTPFNPYYRHTECWTQVSRAMTANQPAAEHAEPRRGRRRRGENKSREPLRLPAILRWTLPSKTGHKIEQQTDCPEFEPQEESDRPAWDRRTRRAARSASAAGRSSSPPAPAAW